MDQQLKIHFEIKKSERHYCFSLPAGAPYGEVYDVLYQMLLEISKMAQEAAKKAEKPAQQSDGNSSIVNEA